MKKNFLYWFNSGVKLNLVKTKKKGKTIFLVVRLSNKNDIYIYIYIFVVVFLFYIKTTLSQNQNRIIILIMK
jgi:hypothetical protein